MAGPTIETAMRNAIEARVETLPMLATYPLVWTYGPAYTPDASKPYIRATWVPNATNRIFIGSTAPLHRLSLLQLDMMGKKSWLGKQVTEIAGQIAAHFPTDLKLRAIGVTCRVTSAPHVAGVISGDVFLQVPVTVLIECFA